jgi:hypothetical protein
MERDSEAVATEGYSNMVKSVVAALRPLLSKIDVAITHDFAYLPQYLVYNQACRDLASEFPNVTWLHFVHSAPWPNPQYATEDPRSVRFKPFANSWLLYPNAYDIPRVAAQYGVDTRAIKVVPHALDWEVDFRFHPLTRALIQEYDLYSPDVFAIYPIRMDRGKRPEELVRLFGALKSRGASVVLLIINFHSNLQRFIDYRDELIRERQGLGLTDREVVFTNQIQSLPGISDSLLENYRFEFPHQVVLDLFHLTNIYVHPSASESYSLVCQEAVACGNMLFLDRALPAMRSLYGTDANYLEFSNSGQQASAHGGRKSSYGEAADRIVSLLHTEAAVRQRTRLRQERNPRTVFRAWLEPLLYVAPR